MILNHQEGSRAMAGIPGDEIGQQFGLVAVFRASRLKPSRIIKDNSNRLAPQRITHVGELRGQ
jgi:hypothetical protein